MNTTYVVELPDGTSIEALSLAAARGLVQDNPGAVCRPVVRYEACPAHRGYESGNCPACGANG